MNIHDMYRRILIDKWCLNQIANSKLKAVTEKKKKYEDLLIEHKRELRAKLKDNHDKYLYHNDDGTGYGEIVAWGGDYDRGWKKIFFPGEKWDEEDIREFIEDNWRYAKPSQYDCTGQIFTWSIKVFNVPSGVVAYIREVLDV